MEIETGRYKVLKETEEAVSLASKIGKRLKPPQSDDPNVMVWRWFMVVVSVMNLMGLAVHVALACGLTPVFSGFAYASDVKTTQVNLADVRVEQLEWRAFDLRVKQCEAIKKHENPQPFTIQLSDIIKRYQSLTSRRLQIPQCNELEY